MLEFARPMGQNKTQLRCHNTVIAESNPSLFLNLALSRSNDNFVVTKE